MITRLLLALAIALLCAAPATGCVVDEPDASCLYDDADTAELADPSAAYLAPRRPMPATDDRCASEPALARVFRPPR